MLRTIQSARENDNILFAKSPIAPAKILKGPRRHIDKQLDADKIESFC